MAGPLQSTDGRATAAGREWPRQKDAQRVEIDGRARKTSKSAARSEVNVIVVANEHSEGHRGRTREHVLGKRGCRFSSGAQSAADGPSWTTGRGISLRARSSAARGATSRGRGGIARRSKRSECRSHCSQPSAVRPSRALRRHDAGPQFAGTAGAAGRHSSWRLEPPCAHGLLEVPWKLPPWGAATGYARSARTR
jgi:hypothetical protein